ncbi:MAG: LamG-like jellyroll fold domain-containing protein [Bacteroidota bacterium]
MKHLILCAFALVLSFCTFTLNAQNNSLSFDGTKDYVNVDDLTLPATFTIELQFKAGDFSLAFFEERIISIGSSSTRLELGLEEVGSNTRLWIYDQNSSTPSLSSVENIRDNAWHHLAITHGETVASIYFDGVLIAEYPSSVDAPPYGPLLRLGAWIGGVSTDTYFNGEIDEVRIWSIVRTAEEIAEAINCQISGQEEDIFAYWNFNQGDANTDNLGEGTLVDLSMNSRNGELINFNLMGDNSNWVDSGNTDEFCDFVVSTTPVFVEEWKIYPNPTKDVLSIFSENSNDYLVYLYTQQGQLLKTLSRTQEEAVDLQAYPNGMYFLVFLQDDKMQMHKVIKE